MLNEIQEFTDYTGKVEYITKNKYDHTYLGRFTFDMLLDFEGLSRVLTIITRGFMWQTNEPKVEYAYRALCAWCSVPDSKNAKPKEDWQFISDFRDLHSEFPELVDKNGNAWLYRHTRNIAVFAKANPNKMKEAAYLKCLAMEKGFANAWRKKVIAIQVPLYAQNTKASWALRFDDILSSAKEQGPLKNNENILTEKEIAYLESIAPPDLPRDLLPTLVGYYRANKPTDTDWVVLPVSNFDAYFGKTTFSRVWLSHIPKTIMVRDRPSYGICRYKVFI